MTKPLSPAAQAVRRDLSQIMHELSQRCRVSISATDTLPITLETNDASLQAGINSLCAAALRAAAKRIKPDLNRTPWLTNEDGYFNETLENMEALGELNAHYQLLAIAAELEAVGPSADELIGLALGREPWATWLRSGGCLESAHCELADLMLATIARWGRPTPQPVAVSERWPEFSDCDPQERVWVWNPVLDHWKLSRVNQSVHTHWLPAHALPTPRHQ